MEKWGLETKKDRGSARGLMDIEWNKAGFYWDMRMSSRFVGGMEFMELAISQGCFFPEGYGSLWSGGPDSRSVTRWETRKEGY